MTNRERWAHIGPKFALWLRRVLVESLRARHSRGLDSCLHLKAEARDLGLLQCDELGVRMPPVSLMTGFSSTNLPRFGESRREDAVHAL
jgi:hypothetical protein